MVNPPASRAPRAAAAMTPVVPPLTSTAPADATAAPTRAATSRMSTTLPGAVSPALR